MHQSTYPTNFKTPMLVLKRGSIALTTTMLWLWLCCNVSVLAAKQKAKPEKTFVNPLEITTPDPLLPQPKQPLTPQAQLKLRAALDELNQQASAKLAAGDQTGAFEIWNRELRLRRALGFLEEVEALGRVGAIAWSENQPAEVQVITRRLQTIQQQTQTQPTVDLRLLQAIATAFEQVREPKSAITAYEQILAAARQRQDAVAVEALLKTIAELHLSWFEYAPAAARYEELLRLARAKSDHNSVVAYLQQLDYIYEKAKQYKQALAIKQQLAELYLNEQQLSLLPAVRLAIGKNYQALGQPQQAFQNYQEAYASAWSLEQYSRASEALRQLIALYRSQGQINEALQTSQILLEADERSYNVYGMMTTYDQIGQIYLNRGNYPQALAAFQKGLEIAQQLKYQEQYFTGQISQVNQRISSPKQ